MKIIIIIITIIIIIIIITTYTELFQKMDAREYRDTNN